MIMITPLPGVTTTKPGSATKPFPGVDAAVYNEAGDEVDPAAAATSCLRRPWPAMLRGIYKERRPLRETYWSKYGDVYFAGDGARIDSDGDFWLLGRVDDVMNVSGHRISTIEVESALVDHHDVAEAAVAARDRCDDRAGDRRVRDAQGRQRGLGREAQGAPRPRRARRSVRSRSPRTSSSRRSSRRRAAARSCGGYCATSPRTGRSVTRRRLPTRRSSTSYATDQLRKPKRKPEAVNRRQTPERRFVARTAGVRGSWSAGHLSGSCSSCNPLATERDTTEHNETSRAGVPAVKSPVANVFDGTGWHGTA